MNARQLKEKFVDFFVARDHVEIPSSNLVPENDPTTLFISAGMHPLVPYLLGQPHHLGKRLTSVQKCIRTGDIDEVGDKFHHTFFEMLGNWSLGDYFKKDMIPWSFEFLTKHLGYQVDQIHVTCFEGDKNAPRDTESHDLWLAQGISKSHIHYLPKKIIGGALLVLPVLVVPIPRCLLILMLKPDQLILLTVANPSGLLKLVTMFLWNTI